MDYLPKTLQLQNSLVCINEYSQDSSWFLSNLLTTPTLSCENLDDLYLTVFHPVVADTRVQVPAHIKRFSINMFTFTKDDAVLKEQVMWTVSSRKSNLLDASLSSIFKCSVLSIDLCALWCSPLWHHQTWWHLFRPVCKCPEVCKLSQTNWLKKRYGSVV